MMTLMTRSTTCWYCSALQLFCGVFAVVEASVISNDAILQSESVVTQPPGNDSTKDRCLGVVVHGPGSCHCPPPLSEIHCHNLTDVPEFRRE